MNSNAQLVPPRIRAVHSMQLGLAVKWCAFFEGETHTPHGAVRMVSMAGSDKVFIPEWGPMATIDYKIYNELWEAAKPFVDKAPVDDGYWEDDSTIHVTVTGAELRRLQKCFDSMKG